METILPLLLIVANSVFVLAHCQAAEPSYAGNDRAFMVSFLGMFFALFSVSLLLFTDWSLAAGLGVLTSAVISIVSFMLLTLNADSAEG